MKLRVEFSLDNAAFDFGHGVEGKDNEEVAATIRDVAKDVNRVGVLGEGDYGHILDRNGNRIGKWEVVK